MEDGKNNNQKLSKKNFLTMLTFGLRKERDYFIENLSMLISGGMPILEALNSITDEIPSKRMKHVISRIQLDVEAGVPLWRTLQNTNLFHSHAISLIKLGEESGKLIDNLKVVAIEQEKDRNLRSKLRSAMIYPVFVLSLTVVIGIGISWFILPKLAIVFSQMKIELPLITKILIYFGDFFEVYGLYIIPLGTLLIFFLFYVIFFFSRTKFIGQFILFSIPGISRLIREIELARFGYLLGILLEAGLPITQALDSLANVSEVSKYRKLFIHLRDRVEEGNSIKNSLNSYKNSKKLIPAPIQQLIITGERSGTLSETLLKVGQSFESKADTSTKNMSVILEPLLLVIVWLGVVTVALAVILPIYNLIGGFNGGMGNGTSTTAKIEPAVIQTDDLEKSAVNSEANQTKPLTLRILPNESGRLSVRIAPSLEGKKIATVLSNEVFEYITEDNGWYQITLASGEIGWVSGRFIELIQ